ncbi:GntR family transcriptional regulator [Paenibacillus mendelii]|uniref:GntR family transcriptional regulator n=1 Tax=Paenibacillus mendelii TaxID=206163 RepID=A0ABV6JBS0_9BACL|nr:GntR family transcriptional regulator [Paenibacillus mendelii]MCQ6560705.1 GntR family transcriptional regulator [Paenibacillus mendelii]
MPDKRPLYKIIIDDLKDKIEVGLYAPEAQLPTEVELAEQYGVSRITSKRALIELEREGLIYRKRGSGSYVKQPDDSDVIPYNGVQNSNSIVSMILPYMATNEFEYIRAATDYLDAKGYYLSIHNSNWSKDKEKELLLKLSKSGLSGIILYPLSTISNVDMVNAISSNGYPIVTMDQYFDSLNVSSVVSDNYTGGYLAASKLIELGHERIAFISSVSIEFRSSVRDRYLGYCQALKDSRIPIDSEWVYTDFYRDVNEKNSKTFYQSLLAKLLSQKVTAIQAEHDILAGELLRNALDAGISIPKQLSIVGFDDHETSRHAEIPITTIAQNYYELGRSAAELIVAGIENKDSERRRIKVPVRLIERESTGVQPNREDIILF